MTMESNVATNPNTPIQSGVRHGATGLVAAAVIAVGTYYGIPEIVSTPVAALVGGIVGSIWRRFVGE